MKRFAVANGLGQLSQLMSLGFILFVLPWFMHVPMVLLSTYVLTSTFLALPMQNLLNRLPELIRGNVALRKIDRMNLSLASYAEFADDSVPPTTYNQSIHLQLERVTYLYHPEDEEIEPRQPHHSEMENLMSHPFDGDRGFRLGPIDLTLQAGEITYIVGGNGSGKSTLAKLITGLYTPDSGSIYLNGVEIAEHNREWYRQHFSAIFSDFYLFDRCLGFAHPDLDEEVQGYLQQLQLDHKVQVKNGILSTTRLSQGQRKRLALLTAYLEERPIYLFDEWASDQDPLFRDFSIHRFYPD